MYVGRFVVVGPEVGAYRVSSRSFPEPRDNRSRRQGAHRRSHRGRPETDNPYVSYNCLRVVETPTGETAAFGNGSHVDPIAEKLEVGYPARDALAEKPAGAGLREGRLRHASNRGDDRWRRRGADRGRFEKTRCSSRPSTSRRWLRPTRRIAPNRSISRRGTPRRPRARSTASSSNTRSVRPAWLGPKTGSRRRSRTATD